MSSFAKGKHAYGFCDRTGFRYPIRDLVRQIEDGRWNGLLVGRDVVDQDQPQLWGMSTHLTRRHCGSQDPMTQ